MPTSSELWNQPRYWSPPSRYMSAGQGRPIALVEHGEMARAGIEPDVENVVLLAEVAAAALGAGVPSGSSSAAVRSIPDVGGVLAEEVDDAVENGAIGQRLAAGVAIEDDDGHAPDALARDAPIGAGGDHVGDALFAPGGDPADLLDGVERALAEIVVLHADEPLLGGAEDGRVVAAPAVRDRSERSSRGRSSAPCAFRISMTIGLPSQTVLPMSSSGRRPAAPSA